METIKNPLDPESIIETEFSAEVESVARALISSASLDITSGDTFVVDTD